MAQAREGTDEQTLLRLSRAELDNLFRAAECGPIPEGVARGTPLLLPGTSLGRVLARLVRVAAWKGKTFRAGMLVNRLTPFDIGAIRARVYRGPSWLDGKDCLVLDYSRTSLVARWVRDEIRLIGPGRYLGKAYGGRVQLAHFALEFDASVGAAD